MKTVYKLALLLVALFVAQGAMAQTKTKSVIETDSTTVTTIVKTFPKFSPKHDIRVGIGTMSVPTSLLLDGGWVMTIYQITISATIWQTAIPSAHLATLLVTTR